ncbi:hypothetical protein [Jiulongibacter sediminis]|uniref:Beta-hexosaminidase bacterial type N-terminal domain-containing protein n=1 Tax=Jiulongibacter sediminis TaxID=1605367 RepID=A0A0P7BTG3_9BACT|nr:hypothetical protein [Jiulongibacter sediminis]KPM48097.1 hypothetical protein AFM12_13010 [Jiulongibacter sediminis]
MRKITALFLYLIGLTTFAQSVSVQADLQVPQIAYAYSKLCETLKSDHVLVQPSAQADFIIQLGLKQSSKPEAFEIKKEGLRIEVKGGDHRGLIYGTLALAEQLKNGVAIEDIKPEAGKPDQEFRGIKFNLPWETYRPSLALMQHTETVKNLKYWEAFLDMMVENRFNVISLWNMHPYTFMIKPKNFPEASPWSESEMEEWQHFYHELFRMAKERALDTYLVHWSIFVSKSFSDAHELKGQNYYPHYYTPGDTTELVKQYTRECVKQVLGEYPNLDGIGISHGEGMAGMTPLERQQWMDDVIIKAMSEVERPVKLIHRVPFSSGLGSEGGTSKNVEVVTRDAMEKLGDTFEGPIWVEMKFNWSHGHSTPRLVKVHGGKLGDTYFDPLPSNYKITWQMRNENFFALRWGVPSFIREHIARNGKAAYTGGNFIGSECYIPGLDYFTAVDKPVDWEWAFQRQWLFYKLWGRLMYDPTTPDEVFEREYVRKYGSGAANLLNALSLSSNTSLQLASFYDIRWDFTLYGEGMLGLQGDSVKYISVESILDHPTTDPRYISISDFVETNRAGGSFGEGEITPLMLADQLERDNSEALRLVSNISIGDNASLMYEVADVKIWANLGLHLSEKIRAGVALKEYQLTANALKKQKALEHLKKGLSYWEEIVKISRPIYKDMRLTHYNHNYFTANDNNWFHWEKVLQEVEEELERVKEM